LLKSMPLGPAPRLAPATAEALRAALDPSSEFAAVQRQFAASWASQHSARLDSLMAQSPEAREEVKQVAASVPKVSAGKMRTSKATYDSWRATQEKYSVTRKRAGTSFFLTARLLERVEIRNFRNIRHLEFEVPKD